MKGVKILAPAKLNLGLAVLNRRVDGYHNIDSVFASIDLCDTLYFYPREDRQIIIKCNHPGVPLDESNLAWQAAHHVQKSLGITEGVTIEIEKRIPLGGGLAGGSTDAAAVLNGLPVLWQRILPMATKLKISQIIGADVSFCVQGGLKRCTGTGAQLEDVACATTLEFALLPQPFNISTGAVYKKWDEQKISEFVDIDSIVSALNRGDFIDLSKNIKNSLEAPAFAIEPHLRLIKTSLQSHGFQVIMSGSGATMFVLLADQKQYYLLKERYDRRIIKAKLLQNLPKAEIIKL